MKYLNFILSFILISFFQVNGQNQLPIGNGEFESINGAQFLHWSNQANNGAVANFSIEDTNLIPGSKRAIKSEIISLGSESFNLSTKSDFGFEVEAGQEYTVSFYAKIEGASSRQIKVVFQSETANSYQGQNVWISNEWQKYTRTFTVPVSGNSNKVKFWYLQAGATYYLDEVSIVPGGYISMNPSETYQTIEGFGAGIKRRTESLYALDNSIRQQIEAYCFEDLEVNMIRFFAYHDLEPENDNNNPYDLDESKLDWTRYDSNRNQGKTKFVAEALQNAFLLSNNGFDHVIGNCNSAPSWLKTNGQHNNGGTLISGGENEYSEFLIAFLKGMKSRYNIDVTAISPTNEPDYEVSYESMNTSTSELSKIILNLNSRLTSSDLEHIKIISPECFRVENANNNTVSTTNYINNMFASPTVKSAIDIVATHTYADSNHDANWDALKVAASNKPVWVTESASLKSLDISMSDAAHYIKWMLKGFNEGGITAYMMHLFYEEEDTNGYSSLVVWKPNGEIVLPKRYHTFKHFTNLIKKGYQLIDTEVILGGVLVGAFKSPNGKKIVLQIFNEESTQDISLDIPIGTIGITHYATSDEEGVDFKIINDISFTEGNRCTNITLPSLSFHSLVYEIDTSVLSTTDDNQQLKNSAFKLFPNPVNNSVSIHFPKIENYKIAIYQIDGKQVLKTTPIQNLKHTIDVGSLSAGIYFIKIYTENEGKFKTMKFLKQ